MVCAIRSVLTFNLIVAATKGYRVVPQGRVYGGEEATLGAFPWMVSINHGRTSKCGGAIISETEVLTAAHCVQNLRAEQYTVVAGIMADDPYGRYSIKRKVVNIRLHEQYQRGSNADDIAIVEVFPAFDFVNSGGLAEPVPLPQEGEPVEGDVTVSGYGDTYPGSPASSKLFTATLSVAPNSCKKLEGMFCTQLGSKGICLGDSGSPIVQVRRGIITLVGIVEGGGTMCLEKPPRGYDVHIDVARYVRWIWQHSTLGNNLTYFWPE